MREENGADHFARAASGEEDDLENGKETGKDTDRQGRQVEGLDIEEEVKGKEDRKIRGGYNDQWDQSRLCIATGSKLASIVCFPKTQGEEFYFPFVRRGT